jgi:3-hydroxyisobutyrate dehydrogenase
MNANMSKPRVALLGLGIMGSGMAGRLLSAGFPTSVYNRNVEKARPFVEAGAQVANTPREAASRADVIISMVTDDHASREVWLGETGALAAAIPGSVLIESSTLTVGWIKELASAAIQRNCELLDAPVTGTKPHAESGQLLFLVGGSVNALETGRPVLSVLGRDVIHLGPSGSGALMKLINNFLAAVHTVSFGEALAMIEAGRLDPKKAISILAEGVPGSPMVKRVAARLESGDFTPHFFMRLMAKDLGYAIEEARKEHLDLKTASAALDVLKQAIANGFGEKDFTTVVQSLQRERQA